MNYQFSVSVINYRVERRAERVGRARSLFFFYPLSPPA